MNIYFFIAAIVIIPAMAILGLVMRSRYLNQVRGLEKKVKEMKKVIKKFNQEVQVASSQVLSVSENLNITLDENNAFAQQLYAETKDMAQTNSEVNENIHGTISGVRQIVELLDEGSETTVQLEKISSHSNRVIKSSLEEIMKIVETIHRIQESSNGTMEYMNKLNNTSGEIVHILETVHNVAKQTQLLSLNAAIESARAGEAGRGFGVVAEEIGKLAVDTALAVKDVNRLIKSIQTEIHSVFDVVKENSERVEQGVKFSSSIGENLSNIDSSFCDVLGMVRRMGELSQNETILAKEVGERIGQVEQTIKETEQSVEDVKESVHKQKHSIEEIAEMGAHLNKAANLLAELFSDAEEGNAANVDRESIEKAKNAFMKINAEVKKEWMFMALDKEQHREILQNILSRHAMIEAAWTNDNRGRFVCSIPKAGIANGSVREWYKKSIQGEDYVSNVYISAITRNPCITLSTPIRNASGTVVGVFGIDVKLAGGEE